MTGHARPALFGALVLFVIYFANVALGAAGAGAPLGDVAEMLTLFAATILFVAGTLKLEAAAGRRNDPDVP